MSAAKPVSNDDEPVRLKRLRGLLRDLLAGTVNAVVSVPSGMATAAMAGVNPLYGLYATVFSPTVSGLMASTQLMQVATTGASALAAGQAVAGYAPAERGDALFLLVMLSGIFLIVFGMLRFGRFIRYISYPVMTAFLSGVAVALVMDQSAQLAGYDTQASTSLGSFFELLTNLGEASWQAALIGGIALAFMVGLGFTRLGSVAALIALVVPSVIAAWWRPDNVELVGDASDIPAGFPPLHFPDLTLLSPDLLGSAFAVAVVIAVQGAGVSQGVPNPDGSKSDVSRDMVAQGLGNLVASFFKGMPTGASVGQSALNVQVGARSRWAMVFHGLVMLVIILVAANLVSMVPMSVLAAIMMVAGFQAIRFADMRSIWRFAGSARWAMVVTFFATLLTSIPMAVATGVILTLVVFIYQTGQLTQVEQLIRTADGELISAGAPQRLASDRVTMLDVHGPLYFAAARTLAERLPEPADAVRPVVVLRIRDNSQVGTTFIEEIGEYGALLSARGGRLYLCGMARELTEQMRRTDTLRVGNGIVLVPGNQVLGASLREAERQANEWLAQARRRDLEFPGDSTDR